jgi:hypothetical protein
MRWTIRTTEQINAVVLWLQRLKVDSGKPYEVEVKRKTTKRSLSQNSLYWLWLTYIADETGNDKDDVHEYFASRYLPKRTIIVFGKEQERRESTAELDVAGFNEYLKHVERDAGELGYPVVGPESPLFEEFYDKYHKKVS